MVQFNHDLPKDVQLVPNRKNYVAEYCRGKKVLHIGCVDAGLTKERINRQEHLHLMLMESAQKVWGLDIDKEGLETLRQLGVPNLFYADTEDLSKLELDGEPDLVVASEVMEHLPNPGLFLEALKRFNCEILISVPNAYSYRQFQSMLQGEELVHEDHNYYFSYATLNGLFRKHGFQVLNRVVYYWQTGATEQEKMLAQNPFLGDGLIYTIQKGESPSSSLREPSKIAFFAGDGGNFHFCQPIIDHFRRAGCDVRVVPGLPNEDEIAAHMRWSDISWFEWGNGPIIAASRMPKTCKIVLRIHRYEVYTDAPRHIQWTNIDHLFFVSSAVMETFKQLHSPDIDLMTHVTVLPNAIDLDKYSFLDHPRGFNIAHISRIHADKNPAMLPQIMAKLVAKDPRFRCYVAGRVQDLAAYHYVEKMIKTLGLEEYIIFDGMIDDIEGWLSDKHYILSTSIIEGLPVSLLEGMAKGLKPVIHNYYGDPSSDFGKEFVYNTIDEVVEMFLNEDYRPSEYRSIIADKYSLSEQLKTIDGLLFGASQIIPQTMVEAEPEDERVTHAIACLQEDLDTKAPYRMPDQRDYAILLSDGDDERLLRAVSAYLQAFTDENVSLHVFAGDRLESIQERILTLIQEMGLDPERIPDISMTDEPRMPKRLNVSIQASQLVIGAPQNTALARRFGVLALDNPTPEALRFLYATKPDTFSLASFDVNAPQRVLVKDWQGVLPTFLEHASHAALMVMVPEGQSETTNEAIAEWLAANGFDPETVPDIAVIECRHPLDTDVIKAGTAWIDDGNFEVRVLVEALGLTVLSPDALAEYLTRPLISVLMPTYNRERFLPESLDSIVSQSLTDCEIIVVDDGSTDNTDEVLARYPMIRYFKKHHSGGPETRNLAIAEARGMYVVWMGSDDAMMPGLLEDYKKIVWQYPEVDVFYGDVMVTDANLQETQSFSPVELYEREYALPSILATGDPIPDTCAMVRKSVYDAVGGYNPDFRRAHDYEFWSRAGRIIRAKHVDRQVVKWRWHDSNMSSGTVKIDYSFEIKILLLLMERYPLQEVYMDLDWAGDPAASLIVVFERLAAQFTYLGDLELARSFQKLGLQKRCTLS